MLTEHTKSMKVLFLFLFLTIMLKIRSLYRHCWRVCLFCVLFAAGAGRTGALRPVKTGQATPLLLGPLLPRHSCRVGCRPPPVQLCSGLDKRWWRVHLDKKEIKFIRAENCWKATIINDFTAFRKLLPLLILSHISLYHSGHQTRDKTLQNLI